ncbi:hypothetical protein CSOJ01_02951 [Colletotrichum sojae]|uniref:Uncharacterized protein n=1 Tax=Colletotrichum sojae TaxID=2175907 RepID=A0A8H6JNT3_9PEZI|nr:hypothetical protein CSOJ01_02951 [Colletotrichum sojae]
MRDTALFLRADDIAEAEGLEKAGRGARTTTDARRSSGRPARQRSRQRASWRRGKEGQGYVQKWEKAVVQRRSEPRHKEMEDEAMPKPSSVGRSDRGRVSLAMVQRESDRMAPEGVRSAVKGVRD